MSNAIIEAINKYKAKWPLDYVVGVMIGDVEVTYGEFIDAVKLCENKRSQLSGLVELNKKPVFTKAMADAGNAVDAGMLFETEAGQYTAEYTNKKSVCFTDENGFLVTVTRGHAKPIDTRTDREKAVDDLRNADEHVCNDINWHENFLQLIVDGQISNVKWTGK